MTHKHYLLVLLKYAMRLEQSKFMSTYLMDVGGLVKIRCSVIDQIDVIVVLKSVVFGKQCWPEVFGLRIAPRCEAISKNSMYKDDKLNAFGGWIFLPKAGGIGGTGITPSARRLI